LGWQVSGDDIQGEPGKPGISGRRLSSLGNGPGGTALHVESERLELSVDSVVFATDFSKSSENAGRYAHLLARYFGAHLIVTHAFLSSQAAMEAEALSHRQSRERSEMLALLSRVAQSMAGDDVKASSFLLEGNTPESIAQLAEKHAPCLVVLGTHGAGRMTRGLIGSTADKILRSTAWPCLVVGPHVPDASPQAIPFKRILFATDFTPEAAHAAIYAVTLATEAGADIDVLNVMPQHIVSHPERIAELEKQFFRELDRVVPQQAREFCNPHTFVDTGNAHRRILEHIRDFGVDLLVIGVRNSSHLDLEIRTSNAFGLVAESSCPVLTIRG
jgi:nucleotide-binding universal stress UspA family protein